MVLLVWAVFGLEAAAKSKFPRLISIELSTESQPELDADWFFVGYKDEQLRCYKWVEECLSQGAFRDIISEIEPGFDHTLFGQIVLHKVLTGSSNELGRLAVISHCLKCLREDPTPLDLGHHGRRFYENWDTQRMVIRSAANIMGENRFDFGGAEVTAGDIQRLAELVHNEIPTMSSPEARKILEDSLDLYNSMLPKPLNLEWKNPNPSASPKLIGQTSIKPLVETESKTENKFWLLTVAAITLLIGIFIIVKNLVSNRKVP